MDKPLPDTPITSNTTGSWEIIEEPAKIDTKEPTYDFFFYGTLLVPAILVRVLGHNCANLKFQDAILPNYTRHCVKGEDYPAVINRDQTAEVVPRDKLFITEDISTRGTVVRGLSYSDVNALDIFEGTQYSRMKLPVRTLGPPSDMQHLPKYLLDPGLRDTSAEKESGLPATGQDESREQQTGEEEVWVYVWSDSLEQIEPDIWSFSDFLKDKAHIWTGMDTNEYDEVERHRALDTLPGVVGGAPSSSFCDVGVDGDEDRILGKTMDGYPDFGHNMKKYWKFHKDYVNLNHGSYGSPPIPVLEAMQKMSDEIESCPDLFMRRSWLPKLTETRSLVADIIGAQTDEVVLVPNATHGVNNVVTQINWQDGDVVVIYGSTYGAVAQTIKHICDRNQGVRIELIEVEFPCTHASIVEKTEKVFSRYNELARPSYTGESKPIGSNPNERVRMAIIDSIASMPGMVYPWSSLVHLCKKYGVLSMVDGAHSIGQQKVNIAEVDCDFFVSNCHKWLMSHRGTALLYVPLRNQHLIRSTFPTSAGYESTRYPTEGVDRPWGWAKQYDWTGTLDWRPMLTVSDAIKWRKEIGGEERIMQYCHTLAVQGGRRVRKLWGTSILENQDLRQGELTAAMVNVVLPDCGVAKDMDERFKQYKYFEDRMFDAEVFAAVYWHGGRWITRLSAQVWLELSDFEYFGRILAGICEDIKQGKHLQLEVAPSDTLHDAEDLPVSDP